MHKITKGIILISKIFDKVEAGRIDYDTSKAWEVTHRVRQHYGVSSELYIDIANGFLRVQ